MILHIVYDIGFDNGIKIDRSVYYYSDMYEKKMTL
ncbi:hypothetical protein SAMN06297421_107108 [Aristaeella hokkaidonensis]|nr:hypothetical protein SAMN06297421_107108 [Aristaeella hokkaidonensis]